jgi:hypothetical protein
LALTHILGLTKRVSLQNLANSISMAVVEQKFQKDFGEILRCHLQYPNHDQGACQQPSLCHCTM